MLPFSVEFVTGRPAGPQLAAAIQRAILSGQLPTGAELPGWHAVAADLRMHPDAVRRAYAGLRDEGWLAGDDEQPRAGQPSPAVAEAARLRLVRQRAAALRAEAAQLGVHRERVHALLDEEGGPT